MSELLIIGAGGTGKAVREAASSPKEDKDSLRSKSYVRVLDLVSEGEIVGLVNGAKSIYFDNVPLQNPDGSYNFSDVTWAATTGTQVQPAIAKFTGTETITSSGLEIKKANPVEFVVTDAGIDLVRVAIQVPALTKTNTDNGNITGTKVEYKIEVKGAATAFTKVVDGKISGKTTSGYVREHTIAQGNYGTAPWTIRITRLTDDSTSSALQNKTYLYSWSQINTEKFRYPNSALVGVSVDAKQFSSIPVRTYDVKLKIVKVPVNYDPTTRVYTGSWNGTFKMAWTDNPAWVFYDLVTNPRYGLGEYISEAQVDKWSLYEIAKYCDQLVPNGYGGTEPRFTCNLYLQTREDAFKVLQDLASVFRGMVYWMGGAVSAVQDAPKEPIYQFTNASVVDGAFYRESSDIKARHNVVLVTWNNPANNYEREVEYVSDEELIQEWGFVNQTEIAAFGCTSRGQARRMGRWLLYTERYETNTITFSVGADGAIPYPGCLIQISDANKAGERRGGRLFGATATTATLDAPFTLVSGRAYTLWANLPNGTLEGRAVTTAAGTTSVLTVASAWSLTPSKDAIYVLASADLVPETLRVLTVTEEDQHQYSVTCLEYNPDKFDFVDLDEPLEIPDVSNLPDMSKAPPEPVAVAISDAIYVKPGGGIGSKIMVSWEQPQGNYAIRGYLVEYQNGPDGNWISLPEVSVNDAEIIDVTDGVEYGIRVRSVNMLGGSSASATVNLFTPLGKLRPPSDVTGLTYTVDPQSGVELAWQAVPDVDIDYYEVRRGAAWASSTVVARIKATRTFVGFVPGASYHVRALDTSGNYSSTSTAITPTVSAPPAPTVTAQLEDGNLRLFWVQPASSFNIDSHEISASGIETRTVKGTSLSIPVDWAGSKVFSVKPVDIGGNTGTTGTVNVNITVPSAPVVKQEVIDNNVLLRWTSAKQSLPITTYEIRRGSSWATATLVGRATAEFSSIFESVGGTYTYLIAGYDSAGNLGAVGSVSATVNQPPDYVLQLDFNTAFAGTKTNMYLEDGGLIGPISTTETFEAHFTARGWASPQDQINAGYPLYAQPSVSSGYYRESVDYGTVLAGTKVTVTPDVVTIAGNPTVTVDISVRKLATDAWTTYSNTTSVYVTDFRYIQFQVTVAANTGDDLARINGVNLRLDSKQKNDAGRVYATATDVGGTVVSFGVPFVDISSITVTAEGTAPVTAIYDFTDVPNPTQFKVLLFNTSGARVSGYVSWAAKGV